MVWPCFCRYLRCLIYWGLKHNIGLNFSNPTVFVFIPTIILADESKNHRNRYGDYNIVSKYFYYAYFRPRFMKSRSIWISVEISYSTPLGLHKFTVKILTNKQIVHQILLRGVVRTFIIYFIEMTALNRKQKCLSETTTGFSPEIHQTHFIAITIIYRKWKLILLYLFRYN